MAGENLQYLCGDWKGEANDQPQELKWTDADSTHKFLDETSSFSIIGSSLYLDSANEFSAPSIIHPVNPGNAGLETPEQVLALAKLVHEDVDQAKQIISDADTYSTEIDLGIYGKHRFGVCGVLFDKLVSSGERAALSFICEDYVMLGGVYRSTIYAGPNTGGSGSLYFIMGHSFYDYRSLSWDSAEDYCLEEIKNKMDSSWRSIISPVYKYCGLATESYSNSNLRNGSQSNQFIGKGSVLKYKANLWTPSFCEVYNSRAMYKAATEALGLGILCWDCDPDVVETSEGYSPIALQAQSFSENDSIFDGLKYYQPPNTLKIQCPNDSDTSYKSYFNSQPDNSNKRIILPHEPYRFYCTMGIEQPSGNEEYFLLTENLIPGTIQILQGGVVSILPAVYPPLNSYCPIRPGFSVDSTNGSSSSEWKY